MSLVDPEKLQEFANRFDELTAQLCDPDLIADNARYRQVAKERSELEPLAVASKKYLSLAQEKKDVLESIDAESDPEMLELFRAELPRLNQELEALSEELKVLMMPKSPYDDKNVIVEIRPAAGGDEAGLFANDLFKMYCSYAEAQGWKVSVLDASPTEIGGLKEIVFEIDGDKVYSYLKFESGVHRVQRVPTTESGGRIHTSTVTVAVLPEADEVEEVQVDPKELRIDTYRSSGAGGQHVNKTDSAIRITHLPTGLVVACQEERSQLQNKERAMRLLKTKLFEMERERQEAELAADRKSQVGTGDRSEKIRTYNYPQSRVTDHRVGVSVQNLPSVMSGDLEPFIIALQAEEQQKLLEEV